MLYICVRNEPDFHEVSAESTENQKGSSLVEVYRKMISAFESLKKTILEFVESRGLVATRTDLISEKTQ
ncbi:hypothetical protein MLD38_010067 [Melastoma candidum]|uniref:Uncharacterized protein n=1 Tax=Melastoma candidum TaxID=119954 RepID=A0ACB9R709_9MYRT|nr:hypothetical protein MLD38_010067 [Melastoma candidum]